MTARAPHRRGQGDRLRAELVRAATALLIAARPTEPPSLRAIARACGVAPSAVYLHFPSQDALIDAVVEQQFAQLRAALDRADGPDPLVAMALAHLGWALAHPGAYQLLFERPDGAGDPARGPGLDLLDRVAAAVGGPDAPARAQRIWAALHGLASLRIHKPDAPWAAPAADDAVALVSALRR